MRIVSKLAIAFSMLLALVSPSAAGFWQWDCVAPEIDGPAGVSAMAALISLGLIVYRRHIEQ